MPSRNAGSTLTRLFRHHRQLVHTGLSSVIFIRVTILGTMDSTGRRGYSLRAIRSEIELRLTEHIDQNPQCIETEGRGIRTVQKGSDRIDQSTVQKTPVRSLSVLYSRQSFQRVPRLQYSRRQMRESITTVVSCSFNCVKRVGNYRIIATGRRDNICH